MTQAIATELRALAVAQRQTGADLARATGISGSAVRRIMRGEWAPTTDQLEGLCLALGTSMTDVIGRAMGKAPA